MGKRKYYPQSQDDPSPAKLHEPQQLAPILAGNTGEKCQLRRSTRIRVPSEAGKHSTGSYLRMCEERNSTITKTSVTNKWSMLL